MTLVQILDFASVFVFALTGALTASRAQLDLVGFFFIGCLTGVGGGTVRDVVLNRDFVFWIADPSYIFVGCAAALLVFFTAPLLENRRSAIRWLDALALAVAVPAGIAVALDHNVSWPIIIIMGMVTGSVGGIARDVVCNEVPWVLKDGELYVSAAFAAGCAFMAATMLGLSEITATLICGAVAICLRAGAIQFGWQLPHYKPRPPREK
ncbi:trimeric intracellular cation channel family protein [Paracoccaceae bacterium GXU_MW_L88]